jgi:hypothetical protein
MEKDFNYWLGYFLTIIISVLMTPLYFICITFIRGIVFLWDILYDTITFMPRASYEYTQARLRRYWREEQERIRKQIEKFKGD